MREKGEAFIQFAIVPQRLHQHTMPTAKTLTQLMSFLP